MRSFFMTPCRIQPCRDATYLEIAIRGESLLAFDNSVEYKKGMKCPNCNIDLQPRSDRGVDVNACPKCNGMWLTPSELDAFENTAIDPEVKAGSLYIVAWPTKLKCPICSQNLKRFEYRFFELQIDCCPEHGFWLAAEDDQKILSLMKQEAVSLDRKFTAEEKWTKQLNHMRSGSFFSKLKTLFQK